MDSARPTDNRNRRLNSLAKLSHRFNWEPFSHARTLAPSAPKRGEAADVRAWYGPARSPPRRAGSGQPINIKGRVRPPLSAALPLAALREAPVPTHGSTNRPEPSEYTRFERARILGARALQISLGAPILIDVPEGLIDPVELAEREFGAGVIPIMVRRGPNVRAS